MSRPSLVSLDLSGTERELPEAAVEATESELLDRNAVTIPAADWERFQAWADAPAKDVPGLRELGSGPVNLAGMVGADLCGYAERCRRKAEAFQGIATK